MTIYLHVVQSTDRHNPSLSISLEVLSLIPTLTLNLQVPPLPFGSR